MMVPRELWSRAAIVGSLACAAAIGSTVRADDRPLILVAREGVAPSRLDVHVGEVVRWRAAAGQRLIVELDAHGSAHEVIFRSGEIRAIFRRSGEHSYTVSLQENGMRSFRGVVIVRNPVKPWDIPPVCANESTARVCFEP